MAHRNNLILAMAVAGIAVAIVLLDFATPPIRIAATLPLVLLLPGYALTLALFARQVPETPSQLLLSVGLSLAITILEGLALNLTPWGLQAVSWALALGGTTLAAGIVALLRGRHSSPPVAAPATGPTIRQGLLMGVGAAFLFAAIFIASSPAPQQGLEGYTNLWMVPADTGSPSTLQVGVSSLEFATTQYKLQLEADGKVIQEWPAIMLEPSQTWEADATIRPELLNAGPIKAVLYRLDAPAQVYRHALWWPSRS
jgi:hypothetical protein